MNEMIDNNGTDKTTNALHRHNILRRIRIIIFLLILFFLLLISFSLNWVAANFGGIGFDEILFHLHMPLKGTGSDYISSYIQKALLPAAGIVVEIIAAFFIAKALLDTFPGKKEVIEKKLSFIARHSILFFSIFTVIWISGEMYRAHRWFGFFDFVKSIVLRSTFLEEEYVNPRDVAITFPDEKRNLIYIFVESGESSAQDRENGGLMPVNYIPEMTEIAKNNISFSQSELIEGAAVAPLCGWTIAGMLAESAGLPLKLYALHNSKANNSMKNYEYFMPGVTSLGDILEDAGYHNVFMAGSDFEFGGRMNYCLSHGNYTVLDYNVAVEREIIPHGYYVWWGFEDEILYKWAKEELLELAADEQPFNFSMLTVDTHSQDGWVCNLCGNEYADQYANVWRCASKQLGEFVAWIQEQDFYENTTVIIAGDHCSMDKDFYGDIGYEMYNGESVRKVYNAFLNSAVEPVQEKNRKFTTLDMFPSTLAAMGCTIEGEHLGLGVNLFSSEETLAEKYGYDYMFEELSKKSMFYDEELLYPDE